MKIIIPVAKTAIALAIFTACRDASNYLAINTAAFPVDATTENKNSLVDVSWSKTIAMLK